MGPTSRFACVSEIEIILIVGKRFIDLVLTSTIVYKHTDLFALFKSTQKFCMGFRKKIVMTDLSKQFKKISRDKSVSVASEAFSITDFSQNIIITLLDFR